MIPDFGMGMFRFPEVKPMVFREYNADILDDPDYLEYGYIEHIYNVQKLGYKEENGRMYFKKIYLHSSLDPDAGLIRLKEFLMKQFIMMEL